MLKIDKSFIRDIPRTPTTRRSPGRHRTAKSLNLGLVGESVETEIQRPSCSKRVVQFSQGFLFHQAAAGDRDASAAVRPA
ncbi:MAG: hypothetical protein H6958_02080 [Chromatiaceae bacterium]|nr:hypothetical protein [Chromatiaceae bacterium]